MAIVNKVQINNESTDTIKLKNIGMESDAVEFEDGGDLDTKYTDIYDMIPTLEGGVKGFGTVAVKNVPSDIFNASADEIVLGSELRLWLVTETSTKPSENDTYPPASLVVVVS
jgi:hypothetical protein